MPQAYREVSFALGSTRWQMVTRVVLPSALPGIGTGSSSASAAASARRPRDLHRRLRPADAASLFASTRTLSVHFYILAREGISMPKAYATAAVLIIAILVINLLAYWLMHRFIKKYS